MKYQEMLREYYSVERPSSIEVTDEEGKRCLETIVNYEKKALEEVNSMLGIKTNTIVNDETLRDLSRKTQTETDEKLTDKAENERQSLEISIILAKAFIMDNFITKGSISACRYLIGKYYNYFVTVLQEVEQQLSKIGKLGHKDEEEEKYLLENSAKLIELYNHNIELAKKASMYLSRKSVELDGHN